MISLFAVLTLGTLGCLLWPFIRLQHTETSVAVRSQATSDVTIYRRQLAQLDHELALGVMSAREAEASKLEIARRLLQASTPEASTGEASVRTPGRVISQPAIAGVLALSLSGVALGLYWGVGAPFKADHPAVAKFEHDPVPAEILAMVQKIEAALVRNPQDGYAWELIAPVYLKLQRNAEAATAFAHANRLLGESEVRLLGLGEAEILKSGGQVTAVAKDAAQRILSLNPDRPDAHFWLALGKEQEADLEGAAREYRQILATAPAFAPWRSDVEQRLSAVVERAQAASVAPATGLAQEQTVMINGMVERLAGRLDQNAHDLDGWQKLVRSYVVLGRTDEARKALSTARQIFATEPAALKQLDTFARAVGLLT